MSELPGRMGKTQPLSVGIMLSLGDVHMNRHLAYFQEHHSGASFRVYNLEVREMIQWLKEDRLDIVSLFYLPALHLEEYEKVFFGIENLVYYGPNLKLPEHAVTPQYVASQPLAQYSPQYEMNRYINHYFTSHACPPQETQAWFSTPYAMMNYCQQNRIGLSCRNASSRPWALPKATANWNRPCACRVISCIRKTTRNTRRSRFSSIISAASIILKNNDKGICHHIKRWQVSFFALYKTGEKV